MKFQLGATAVEYALLLSLVAVAAIGALTFAGDKVAESLCKSGGAIEELGTDGIERRWIDGDCVSVLDDPLNDECPPGMEC